MLFIISPAKSQNFDKINKEVKTSNPIFIEEINSLIVELKKLSIEQISTLMGISSTIAKLNYQRFQDFQQSFSMHNAKPAIFAYSGDVYTGINIEAYDNKDFAYIQQHLRIISGLYGLLRPLDLIQAYRLEMKLKFVGKWGNNLYHLWKNKITEYLNKEMMTTQYKYLINLSSKEYFAAIDSKKLQAKIINIDFKNYKNNQYQTIGILAKKARGKMVDFVVKNKITNLADIKQFNVDGYRFSKDHSNNHEFIFLKE